MAGVGVVSYLFITLIGGYWLRYTGVQDENGRCWSGFVSIHQSNRWLLGADSSIVPLYVKIAMTPYSISLTPGQRYFLGISTCQKMVETIRNNAVFP